MRKIALMEEIDEDSSIYPNVGTAYIPVRVLEIELGEPLAPLSAFDKETGRHYHRARCLIRLHGQPLGIVELQIAGDEILPCDYAPHIWDQLAARINEHLRQDDLPPVAELNLRGLTGPGMPRCIEAREQFMANAPFVSVVIATHNRTERLRHCLDSLLALRYPRYEIIVVDNAPDSSATASMITLDYEHTGRVRYLFEEHVGTSIARNRGIMAARGEIVAFTDDDVVVDSNWLVELVRAFHCTDDVACVTGLLLPLELDTPAQSWLEEYGGYSKGFDRRIFDMRENHPGTPLHPYTAGQFGTGASMAFTSSFLRGVGGFDPALGPGRPAQGAEDITLFFLAVMQGHRLVYEPAALAYHLHRRSYANLKKQIYNYGIGLTVYLLRNIMAQPGLVFDIMKRIPYGLYFVLSARSPKNRKKSANYPAELTKLELRGMFYGPIAYLLSWWSIRRESKMAGASRLSQSNDTLALEKES